MGDRTVQPGRGLLVPEHGSPYELYYWPVIQGRGEFVRLVLEDTGADYIDVARLPEEEGGGAQRIVEFMQDHTRDGPVPFAPPILKSGDLVLAQTAVICRFVAEQTGLAPASPADRLQADQLMLTIADAVVETHDVHHPISGGLYYEDQKHEAARRAAIFLKERLPRFLGYFETVIEANDAGKRSCLVGADATYIDLALFQMASGLEYAFPTAFAHVSADTPRLVELVGRVAERPGLSTYLRSERRIPFNEWGIFRHYPELDATGEI